MTRAWRRLALGLLMAGCETERTGAEATDLEQVDGVWTVELSLESPIQIGRTPEQGTVQGELALLQESSLARHEGFAGPPSHTGSYTMSFAPFGFEVSGGRAVPVLIAHLTAADSVEIDLQPGREDPVRMRGVLVGDSITGRWSYQHRGGKASGRFVMRRP